MCSPSLLCGVCIPGVSTNTSCISSRLSVPVILFLVVWGLLGDCRDLFSDYRIREASIFRHLLFLRWIYTLFSFFSVLLSVKSHFCHNGFLSCYSFPFLLLLPCGHSRAGAGRNAQQEKPLLFQKSVRMPFSAFRRVRGLTICRRGNIPLRLRADIRPDGKERHRPCVL